MLKVYEKNFNDYLKDNINLHPYINKHLPNITTISKMNNLIFYGPPGIGKYTQVLKFINNYSPNKLIYEKKLFFSILKQTYLIRISDIHYEIDMALLGCNSKTIWHELYNMIRDIIASKPQCIGIIVCKNFKNIHSELLDIFYSYMQTEFYDNIKIFFILITEAIGFIPDNILNQCKIINMGRPSTYMYKRIVALPKKIKLENIENIRNLIFNNYELENSYWNISDKIINVITDLNQLEYLKFRDLLYDIFIYDICLADCIHYILTQLILSDKLNNNLVDILIITYNFFKYYNNNYRPIYHLENYMFILIDKIHGLSSSSSNIKITQKI